MQESQPDRQRSGGAGGTIKQEKPPRHGLVSGRFLHGKAPRGAGAREGDAYARAGGAGKFAGGAGRRSLVSQKAGDEVAGGVSTELLRGVQLTKATFFQNQNTGAEAKGFGNVMGDEDGGEAAALMQLG